MLYQAALKEVQTWPVMSSSSSPSKPPNLTRISSGALLDRAYSGEPQAAQNALNKPGWCSNSVILSAGPVSCHWDLSIFAFAENAVPFPRRHWLQWQYRTSPNEPVTEKVKLPHKQVPLAIPLRSNLIYFLSHIILHSIQSLHPTAIDDQFNYFTRLA